VILLIDIGNSRVKWTTVSRGKARPSIAAARPDAEALADQGAQWWGDLKAPRRILASNVAGPAFAAALDEWCKAHWQVEVEFIAAQARARGVRNAYTVPDRLGPDRWAALIAARRRSDGAVCVIDAGTALTLDVLAAGGEHQGGLIIPGLTMMRRALLEGTGAIRSAAAVPEHGAVTLLARDTRDGVEGGTLYALVAIIDRVVADVSVELGQTPLCLISGGDAGDLLPLLAGDYHHVPDLVLEGLAILAEKS
jgi:type III pantothenate kinase